MPRGAGFAEDGGKAGGVDDGDGDGIDAAGDPGFDNLVLLGRVEVCGAVPDHIGAEFLCSLFSAGAATDEVGIALGFGHDAESEVAFGGQRRGGGSGSAANGLHEPPVTARHNQGAGDDHRAEHGQL